MVARRCQQYVEPLSPAVNRGNDLHNTNSPSASVVTAVRNDLHMCPCTAFNSRVYYSRAAFISFKSFGLCGYYPRAATIRGWRLFEEIRKLPYCLWPCTECPSPIHPSIYLLIIMHASFDVEYLHMVLLLQFLFARKFGECIILKLQLFCCSLSIGARISIIVLFSSVQFAQQSSTSSLMHVLQHVRWLQASGIHKHTKTIFFSTGCSNIFDVMLTYHLEESVVDYQEGNTSLYELNCQPHLMFLYSLVQVVLIYSQ